MGLMNKGMDRAAFLDIYEYKQSVRESRASINTNIFIIRYLYEYKFL